MYTVKLMPEFSEWLNAIADGLTRRRLARRLEKVQRGNLGDVKSVGDGVWEMV
jgi:putative addiction module killer protein